jgi:hypothetical protein
MPSGTGSAYVGGVTELPGGVAVDQMRQRVRSALAATSSRRSCGALRLWFTRWSVPLAALPAAISLVTPG